MLSGGQKARITLARALYTDADLYLLDDPLSAVDTAVAKHIFEKAILGYLKDKTRVLVTHQIQFIRRATNILVLHEGKCVALGSYEHVINSGIDLLAILKEMEQSIEVEKQSKPRNRLRSRGNSTSSSNSKTSATSGESSGDAIGNGDIPKIEEESKEKGAIKSRLYWEYFKACRSPILGLFTVIISIVSQALYHYFDIYLSEWTNAEDQIANDTNSIFDFLKENDHSVSESFVPVTAFITNLAFESTEAQSTEFPPIDRAEKIIVFSILMVALWFTALFRGLGFYTICMRSSINLHNSIFDCVLRAPMKLFDNNPVGRILNRFTKDLGTVDEMMPPTAFDVQMCLMTAIGAVVVVSMVQPYLIIPAIFLFLFVVFIRGVYMKPARDIKRFEGITRSPLYNHVSNTLTGLTTIRALRVEKRLVEQFYIYQDDHTGCSFLFYSAARSLGLFCDAASTAYITVVTFVIMALYKDISGGDAGLAISSALILTGMAQWACRQTAELENQVVSVERILEYTKLEAEADLETPLENKPKPSWPEEGRIEFKNVCMYYSNSPKPALADLNFVVQGGEKIGIVGRTGAGKSSMLSTLFRMTEPTGVIDIDRVNTKTLGLHDLRKKISIIPQDPVIFRGPVRRNIDPFNQSDDNVLWQVLDEVQLKHAISELEGKLDADIAEGGANLSVGQRQLICLARAILRQNKILVIDEATANVDQYTDSLIQSTIRTKFADCTVLTIAHRLNTIIDCDRIIVLDAGSIIEYDLPHVLLQNSTSLFSLMVNQTGKAMSAELHKAAKEAFEKKHEIID